MATSKPNKISIKRTIRKGGGPVPTAVAHKSQSNEWLLMSCLRDTLCPPHPEQDPSVLCSWTLHWTIMFTYTKPLCFFQRLPYSVHQISASSIKNTIYVTVSYFKQLNHFPAFQRYTEHFSFFIYKTQCECSSCVLRALYPSCISINCDCNPISCNGCYIIDRWSLLPTEPEVIHMKLFIVQILR